MTILQAGARRLADTEPPARTGEADVELVGVTKAFGGSAAVDDVSLAHPTGRVLLAPRSIRLRQDDDAPHDRGFRTAEPRRDLGSRARRWLGFRPTGGPRTWFSSNWPCSLTSACSRTSPSACGWRGRGGRGQASRRRRGLPRQPRGRLVPGWRASFRVGSSNGLRSPARSSTSRPCFCSTSPSPRWTSSCGRRCSGS